MFRFRPRVMPTAAPPTAVAHIPAGGQTAFQWTTGDFVISSIFVLPTSSVTDLTANWSFQDFLGGGNTETWAVFVNNIAVADRYTAG